MLERLLSEFENLETRLASSRHSYFRYAPFAFSLNERSGDKPIDLWLSALIHGDEVAGLEVLVRVLESFKFRKDFAVAFSLGNVPAARAGKRFLERDLNRSFSVPASPTLEIRRALELSEIADRSRFALDFHQTVEPTLTPFFVLPCDLETYAFARGLNASRVLRLPIVGFPLEGFSTDGKTVGERVLEGGGRSVTIELGERGFSPDQVKFGTELALEAIRLAMNPPPPSKPMADESIFMITNMIPSRDGAELVTGLVNFMDVRKGEIIARSKTGDLKSPVDGKLLFPKYGELGRVSPELADLAVAVPALKAFGL